MGGPAMLFWTEVIGRLTTLVLPRCYPNCGWLCSEEFALAWVFLLYCYTCC